MMGTPKSFPACSETAEYVRNEPVRMFGIGGLRLGFRISGLRGIERGKDASASGGLGSGYPKTPCFPSQR